VRFKCFIDTLYYFNGGVEVVRCMVKEGLSNPLAAEAWAGGQALKFGRELHLNNIILEGDAKIVVDAINLGETNGSKIGILVEDMKLMMLGFPQCTVCAVGRVANSTAHVIARMAIRENVEHTWRSYNPECIHEIVMKESVSPSSD
jgi:ribonuclease HI